ncbi:MAG: hypothetical protein ACLPUT_07145 [Solirubrobacteraceae bacterium]
MVVEPDAPGIGDAWRPGEARRRAARAPALAVRSLTDADVEEDVARALYGDPARRHRAYATRGHDRTAEPAPLRSTAAKSRA